MTKIKIRQERPLDKVPIAEMILQSYHDIPYSNHREHLMVERLRASSAYIPQLSLVAEIGDALAGHVMMTRITIRDPAADTAAKPYGAGIVGARTAGSARHSRIRPGMDGSMIDPGRRGRAA